MSTTEDRVCLVSAFIDIKRKNWNNEFTRSNEEYLRAFVPYLKLNEEMIVFVDKNSGFDIQSTDKVKIISLDEEILSQIRSWGYRTIESEIMSSEYYKSLVTHRPRHPENTQPLYNVVQHCKTDFIRYVIENNLSSCEYFAWSDFGYFARESSIPSRSLDLNKIDRSKMNFCLINRFDPREHLDIIKELRTAPEIFSGGFFIANRENHLVYNKLYHSVLENEFYDNGIVDDDQHVILRCYIKNPDLFCLYLTGWCRSFIVFQKTE